MKNIHVSLHIKFSVFSLLLFFATHLVSGQSSTPLKQELELYEQAVKNKDHNKASQSAYTIAKLYHESKDVTKGIDYLNHALVHLKKSDDQSMIYTIHHQLGMYNMEIKKYPKAIEGFQEALIAARKSKDDLLIKQELLNVANNYAYIEKYKKSIEYAEEALSLAITQKDTALELKCYQLLANYYDILGNKNKSIEYLAHYNMIIKAQQNAELEKHELNKLKKYIDKVGSEKLATQSQLSQQTKILHQTNDALRSMEGSLRMKSDSLRAVEAISKNREMEINLLQKDKELASVKIKEQETRIQNEALILNFIIVGSLLSVALIIVLVIGYRRKIKSNRKIEQQNKNIKSSINYAKRIQEAMLPRVDQHRGVLENSFILFKPRDTVSGDFYWLSEIKSSKGNDIAFAVVDCTGHGVPGAFMSMIGINALNGLINRGVTDTNIMLDSLDHEISTALRQESSGNNDGMDAALCIYRQSKKIIEFTGAKLPLVYIQDKQLVQIKGDVHSIGGSKRHKQEFLFKKHEVAIDKPTMIYLFSDGYGDQFGGKKNTKFMSKKLNQLLLEIHQLPMPEQMNILNTTIEDWKGTTHQTDDILVMGLKIEPSQVF